MQRLASLTNPFSTIVASICAGGTKVKICGAIQYLNLVGVAIGYTIAASISMM